MFPETKFSLPVKQYLEIERWLAQLFAQVHVSEHATDGIPERLAFVGFVHHEVEQPGVAAKTLERSAYFKLVTEACV